MIEYIVQAEPHLTVRSLIQKLKRIERLGVVTALKQFFCGMYPSNNENTAFCHRAPDKYRTCKLVLLHILTLRYVVDCA